MSKLSLRASAQALAWSPVFMAKPFYLRLKSQFRIILRIIKV